MRASVVGSYRILGPLGTGGMGTVYCAEHVLIGKPAAVKVLLPQYGRDRGIVARFFNEARAVSAIQHPGIVELYDFGYMDDGSAYIVMELLRGETLASRIAGRGRLTEAESLAIVRGIAGALGAVHAKRIVHRDIKPDNVFLVPDPEAAAGERVKVLDFGIAKLTDDPGALSQTSTHAMLGTPMYMSPEQCRGAGQVDHRADLYAVGCVLFEMLAGVPPFVGEGAGEVIGAHLHVAPPALRTLVPEVSPLTEQIATTLLAKRPEDRLQTAGDLLRWLDRPVGRRAGTTSVINTSQVTIRLTTETPHPAVSTTLGTAAGVMLPPARSRSRPHALAGAAVVALAIAAIVFVLGVRRHAETADSAQALDATRPRPPIASGADATAATSPTAQATAPDALLPAPHAPQPPAAPQPPTAPQLPDPPSAPASSTSPPTAAAASVPAPPSQPPRPPDPDPPRSPAIRGEHPSRTAPPLRTRRSSEPKKSGPKADASSRKAPVVEDL